MSNAVSLIGDSFGGEYCKWVGGVLGDDGCIYAAPCDHKQILKIDPDKGTTDLVGDEIKGEDVKYNGGAKAANGCIYFAPSSAKQVLKYNPGTNTTKFIGSVYDGDSKWNEGVRGSDGCLYFAPSDQSRILRVDPSTDSTSLVGEDMGKKKKLFSGCVASKASKFIYFIPSNFVKLMKFDVATQACSFVDISNLDVGITQQPRSILTKWWGGVLGPDGCIYGVPSDANKMLKFDPETNKKTLVGDKLSGLECKYSGGVLASDNCIYCIPCNADKILRYDTQKEITNVVRNTFPDQSKWMGGVLGAKGTIIGVPFQHNRVLKINPSLLAGLDVMGLTLKQDSEDGKDMLNLDTIAKIFAKHLASKSLEPPFVLGILGKWGSGKSFFFNLIKKHLIQIQLSRAGYENQFVDSLYLIRFSAWTYSKENLWASMMFCIFQDLSYQLDLEAKIEEAKAEAKTEAEKEAEKEAKIKEAKRATNATDVANIWGNLEAKIEDAKKEAKKATNVTDVANILGNLEAKIEDAKKEAIKEAKTEEAKRATNATDVANILGKISVIELYDKLSTGERKYFQDFRGKELINFLKGIQNAKRNKDRASKRFTEIFEKQMNEDQEELKKEEAKLEELVNRNVWEKAISDWEKGGRLSNAIWDAVVERMSKYKDENEEKYKEMLKKGFQDNFADLGIPTKLWACMKNNPILFLVIILIITLFVVAVSYINKLQNTWEKIAGFASGLVTSVAPIILFWQRMVSQVQEVANKYSGEIEKATSLLSDVEANLTSASDQSIVESKNRIEHLQKRLRVLKGESLQQVVNNRINSDPYLTELGIMHQVHKDLDNLSDAMYSKYQETKRDPRIVLFVDDLDRCAPERVIDVLEAMHLLISSKVFVVVVAIDSRYVCLSLEKKKYKDILRRDRSPTGIDFLGKIIQVPFRLPAMSEDDVEEYVKDQGNSSSDNISTNAKLPDNENPPVKVTPVEVTPVEVTPVEVTPRRIPPSRRLPSRRPPSRRPPSRRPQHEDPQHESSGDTAIGKINDGELEDLIDTCKQFDLVPRTVTYLTNVYKLMDLIWSEDSKKSKKWGSHDVPRISLILLAMGAAENTRDGINRLFNLMEAKQHDPFVLTKKRNITVAKINGTTTKTEQVVTMDRIQMEGNKLSDLVCQLCPMMTGKQKTFVEEEKNLGGIDLKNEWKEFCIYFNLARCFSFNHVLDDEYQIEWNDVGNNVTNNSNSDDDSTLDDVI